MSYIGWIILTAVAVACQAEKTMKLEHFLASLAKSENFFENEDSYEDSDDRSNQFSQRSGFLQQPQELSTTNQEQIVAALLQNLTPQQRNSVLSSYSALLQQRSPRDVQTSAYPLDNSASLYYPLEKESSQQSDKNEKEPYNPNFEASQNIPSLQVQQPTYSSLGQQVQYANSAASQTATAQASAASQKQMTSADSGKNVKSDRQGPYAYETGYQPAGYGHQLRSVGGYEHEPQGYSVPTTKQVAIKLDPLGLLKAILSGLPRPLLNLNGKVFFGVELGKGVGLAKGRASSYAAAPQQHYGGGGTVITLG